MAPGLSLHHTFFFLVVTLLNKDARPRYRHVAARFATDQLARVTRGQQTFTTVPSYHGSEEPNSLHIRCELHICSPTERGLG